MLLVGKDRFKVRSADGYIRIHSGYGARRFNDGDIREIDLCEDCAFELLSPHARKVASEDDQPRVVTPHTPES